MIESKIDKDFTYDELLKELNKIKLYIYQNGSKSISPISAKQQKIFDAFSIKEEEIKAIIK